MNRIFENYLKNNPHPYKEGKSDISDEKNKDKIKNYENLDKKLIDELYQRNDNSDMYNNDR